MTVNLDMPEGRVRGFLARAQHALSGMGDRARASRAAIIALAIRLANAVLAYLSQIILARLMGAHEFGIYAMIWVWLLVGTSFSGLGFAEAAVRHIPLYRDTGQSAELRGFLRMGAIVAVASSSVVALLIVVGSALSQPFLDPAYQLPLVLMAAALPIACSQAFLEGIGRAYLWTVPALLPVYVTRHALLLMYLAAAIVIFGLPATAGVAFATVVLAMLTSLATQTIAIRRRLTVAVPSGPRVFHRRTWFRGSAPFALMFGVSQFFTSVDVIVLSFLADSKQIAIYFAATRVAQLAALVSYATSLGSMQLFASAHAVGDHARLRRLVHAVTFWNTVLAVLVSIAAIVTGQWLLGLFGPDFAAGFPALVVLTLGFIARALAGPGEDVLNMTGHSGLTARIFIQTAILAVALCLGFTAWLGILGAAVGMTAALAIRSLWLAVLVKRTLGLDCSILSAWPSQADFSRLFARARRVTATGAGNPAPAE